MFQTPNGKFISECDWSSDSSKIALKVNDANGYNAEIYVINASGDLINTVVSGLSGALGGLNFSVTGTNLIYTRDISGYENPNYRQLDTHIFLYDFITGISSQLNNEKPNGYLDLDVRYSPNESEFIFTNTSNDGFSVKNIQKNTPSLSNLGVSRTTIFTNASMPDWE